jgi:hypothetical protein
MPSFKRKPICNNISIYFFSLSNQGECKEFFDKANLEYDSNTSD